MNAPGYLLPSPQMPSRPLEVVPIYDTSPASNEPGSIPAATYVSTPLNSGAYSHSIPVCVLHREEVAAATAQFKAQIEPCDQTLAPHTSTSRLRQSAFPVKGQIHDTHTLHRSVGTSCPLGDSYVEDFTSKLLLSRGGVMGKRRKQRRMSKYLCSARRFS